MYQYGFLIVSEKEGKIFNYEEGFFTFELAYFNNALIHLILISELDEPSQIKIPDKSSIPHWGFVITPQMLKQKSFLDSFGLNGFKKSLLGYFSLSPGSLRMAEKVGSKLILLPYKMSEEYNWQNPEKDFAKIISDAGIIYQIQDDNSAFPEEACLTLGIDPFGSIPKTLEDKDTFWESLQAHLGEIEIDFADNESVWNTINLLSELKFPKGAERGHISHLATQARGIKKMLRR